MSLPDKCLLVAAIANLLPFATVQVIPHLLPFWQNCGLKKKRSLPLPHPHLTLNPTVMVSEIRKDKTQIKTETDLCEPAKPQTEFPVE